MSAGKLRILIIDDEDSLRLSLASILELEGYEVSTVGDGLEAVELIKKEHFDVFFCDMRMPGMSGNEVFKEIKKIRADIVGIIMTAYAMNDLISDALNSGAFACINKPFEIETILDLINKIKERNNNNNESNVIKNELNGVSSEDEKIYSFTRKEFNEEKIKVLSKFSSVVSHDLKNVVGGLYNVAYYLSKALKVENETQKRMISLLSIEVEELNKRITDFLDMTRVKQLTKEKYDLQDIVLKAINESKVDGIIFQYNLFSAKVYVDFERVKQVFFNIIKNAKDSMNNKGTISINMSLDNSRVTTTIVDCGQGMDKETLKNCFDPMFSTKLAKSIGMGLTVARQIVEMHNGAISISSETQKGTTVVVSIPILK